MKNKWLFCFIFLIGRSVQAQDVIGTPLNVPYPTLLNWLTVASPNKISMENWISAELLRYALPQHKQFAKSVKITLKGMDAAHACTMDSFAQARSSASGTPEITFCIRLVQYLEQLQRIWFFGLLNEQFDDQYKERRGQIYDRYLRYLHLQRDVDRDNYSEPTKFAQFCSLEFYFLVNALGFFGEKCPPEAANKHQAEFSRFYWSGDLLPAAILKGTSAQQRHDVMERYSQSFMTTEWRAIWRSAALHELGHFVSCHQGTFAGLSCSSGRANQTAEQREATADSYALTALARGSPDIDQQIATVNSLIMQSLSRAFFNTGKEISFARILANQHAYNDMYVKLLADKDFAKFADEFTRKH
jgi:hypothetical protein